MLKNILIIGTGAWGTAISQVLTDKGNHVYIYGNSEDEIADINLNHANSKFFKNIIKGENYLSNNLLAFNDLNAALNAMNYNPDIIILAIPTNAFRSVLLALRDALESIYSKDIIFVNLAKGYDDLCNSMHYLFRSIFTQSNYLYYSLLGPSHAEEVIQRKLTCINLIPEVKTYICSLVDFFTNDYFKVHLIDDLDAAEFYSSIKNVYALMSGILCGLGYGQNARAALFTYSIFEMNKFSEKLYFKNDSLFGLSGIGDLAVTCYSTDSRNFSAGKKIGELNSYIDFYKQNDKTVEGIRACKHIYEKMDKLGLDFIIIKTANDILYKNIAPNIAISNMFELFNNMI